MIPAWHRQKAGGPQLGARGPGDVGPFGRYGALEDAEPDDDGGGLDDEPDDQDHDGAQDLDQPEPRLHMVQDF